MFWLQRHATAAFYTAFGLTVTVMICCIVVFYYYAIIELDLHKDSNVHPQYFTEYSLMFYLFFGTANAMAIFRMFGLNVCTIIIHALIHISIVACLIAYMVLFHVVTPVHSFYQSYSIQIYFIIIVYILQCLLAMDLIIFKPGKTTMERELRSGMHAFLGVVTFVLIFWNTMQVISMLCINPRHNAHITKSKEDPLTYDELLFQPSILIVLVAIYMLLILFILLTPFFRFDLRQCALEDRDDILERDSAVFCIDYCMPVKCTEDEKAKILTRQGLSGRYQNTSQILRMDQTRSKLNEAWRTEEVPSLLSFQDNVCVELTPQISKIPSSKRAGEMRKRRSDSSLCQADNIPSDTKFNFLRPSLGFHTSSWSLTPQSSTNLKRSSSQISLDPQLCFPCTSKSLSVPPVLKCRFEDDDDDDGYQRPCSHSSVKSCNENNYRSALRSDNRSQMEPHEYLTSAGIRSYSNNNLPCVVDSNTSEIFQSCTQNEHLKKPNPGVIKCSPRIERKRTEDCNRILKCQHDQKTEISGERCTCPQLNREDRRYNANKTSAYQPDKKSSSQTRESRSIYPKLEQDKPIRADYSSKAARDHRAVDNYSKLSSSPNLRNSRSSAKNSSEQGKDKISRNTTKKMDEEASRAEKNFNKKILDRTNNRSLRKCASCGRTSANTPIGVEERRRSDLSKSARDLRMTKSPTMQPNQEKAERQASVAIPRENRSYLYGTTGKKSPAPLSKDSTKEQEKSLDSKMSKEKQFQTKKCGPSGKKPAPEPPSGECTEDEDDIVNTSDNISDECTEDEKDCLVNKTSKETRTVKCGRAGTKSQTAQTDEKEPTEADNRNKVSKKDRDKNALKCSKPIQADDITKYVKEGIKTSIGHVTTFLLVAATSEATTSKNAKAGKKKCLSSQKQGKPRPCRYFSSRYGAYYPYNSQLASLKASKLTQPSFDNLSTLTPDQKVSNTAQTELELEAEYCRSLNDGENLATSNDQRTTNSADETARISRSSNTYFTKPKTTASQTRVSLMDSPNRPSLRDQWINVPSLHGMHEIKSQPQRSRSLNNIEAAEVIPTSPEYQDNLRNSIVSNNSTRASQDATYQRSASLNDIVQPASVNTQRNMSWPQIYPQEPRYSSLMDDKTVKPIELSLHGSSSGNSSDSNLGRKFK